MINCFPTTRVGVTLLSKSSISSRMASALVRISFSSKEMPWDERNSFAIAQVP